MANKSFISGTFPNCTGGPEWGMSLKAAGNMRFRWGEENTVRDSFLSSVAGQTRRIVPVELIHSHTVYNIVTGSETEGKNGDGMISRNKTIMPVVTAADCMPIFLYEPETGVFCALHSGWKGTGIVQDAILLAHKEYGARTENFRIVMGPHIHDCCYTVGKERADWFTEHFTPKAISTTKEKDTEIFHLSLAQANLAVLEKLGIPNENIFINGACTSCDEQFGSFRRETSSLPAETPLEKRLTCFTVQAAWIKW